MITGRSKDSDFDKAWPSQTLSWCSVGPSLTNRAGVKAVESAK